MSKYPTTPAIRRAFGKSQQLEEARDIVMRQRMGVLRNRIDTKAFIEITKAHAAAHWELFEQIYKEYPELRDKNLEAGLFEIKVEDKS